MTHTPEMDQRTINTIKGLIMDTVRKANSGHPGGAMSSTDFAYTLFKKHLRFDPKDSTWFNRDRFILSCGHESALLYTMLTLTGFIGIEDLEQFRQLDSRTPGHPENHMTPGVEATTGPLGQGIGNAVGMAVAEAMLRARLGDDVVSHYTYALCSDGDIQEPVSYGAAALAGLWGLNKLIVFYDSNKIQLAGPTADCDCADYKAIYEGLCWNVIDVEGNDAAAVDAALMQAKTSDDKPTLIIGHTTMAKGCSTLEGNHSTHGSPLPPEEIAATKKKLGLDPEKSFDLPDDIVDAFRSHFDALSAEREVWTKNLEAKCADDAFATTWKNVQLDPADRVFNWPTFEIGQKIATRKAWGASLESLIEALPLLVGGSADLDPSNQTQKFRDTTGHFSGKTPLGRSLNFGVREFPMAAILNGIALHGGLIPFGATFLMFSDYERNAIRMSALQELPVLHVFTHDSFYVGEDGPTHQPIEHASSLRLIPNLLVLRPADATEAAACVEIALRQKTRPSCLLLTRQGLPVLDPAVYPNMAEGVKKGGYVLQDPKDGEPDMILFASGSEASLALEAAQLLTEYKIRIVNVPSFELFGEQSQEYIDSVILPDLDKRVAVEAGCSGLWYKFVGHKGFVHGINHYGASAPANQLADRFGFTAEKLASAIRSHFA
ncbi:transketolase [Desulfovibrio inopinatus]|uniref:transketolase n=1 Tax=Desulfovibrio inopinatus TaxID=102109 RepID=UPI0003FC970C|nr:transketolase [Desulfovibrio inopinatus]